MRFWLAGLVACLLLLAGCGGFGGRLGQAPPYPPGTGDDGGELAAEELNSKHLEELYAKSGIRAWDPDLEAELKKWEHQAKFDVPIQMNQQVKAYLIYFSTEKKAVVRRWLERSTRYLPLIRGTFQEYGLPEDLAYLAMIESGFNPNAGSPAGAIGLWQFIKGTGLRYGLVINPSVDERRDPVKSTRAAAKYLTDLYQQFGSWYLAAASYNCGEGRVQKELRKGHRNFWELSDHRCLPGETKNYVPQLIAATIIAKNPEKFGFRNVAYQPPLRPEELQLAQSSKGPAPPVMASMAVRPPKKKSNGPAALQPRNQPQPVTAARKAQHPSRGPQKYRGESSTGMSQARGPRPPKGHLQNGHRGPYVASLLGFASAKPKKSHIQKNKSQKQGNVYVKKKTSNHRVISQSRKPGPALLAKGSQAKPPKAHIRKKETTGKKGRLARTKSKPLLISRAR